MRVTLYTRPECPLCDELKADVLEFQRALGFELVECNILEDAQAMARYHWLVPVLDIEGGPALYPPHHWDAVGAALRQAHTAI